MMEYDVVIGLEIHVQLNTQSKMFCRCSAQIWEKAPNSHVCPVCLGLPGALPIPNPEAVNKTIQAGLALGSKINPQSFFERKHYFYPDLPKGYQISQLQKPICIGGSVKIGETEIHLDRAHLEEDAGKLLHVKDSEGEYSLVDFNRSGIPLLEIVSKPEIKTSAQAGEYAKKIQQLMRYAQVSSADMEKGSLRVDANISLKPKSESKLGTKVEVKNMNSFRSLERALSFEVNRQKDLLEKGERITQETRGWVEKSGQTVTQRSKEEAHDYRYFPDPDLPAFEITTQMIEKLRKSLPELPDQKIDRFVSYFSLVRKDAELVCYDSSLADWFEAACSDYLSKVDVEKTKEQKVKEVYNWVSNELLRLTNLKGVDFKDLKILPSQLVEILHLINESKILISDGKKVFEDIFTSGKSVEQVLTENNFGLEQNNSLVKEKLSQIIQENEKAFTDYASGKEAAFGFIYGKLRSYGVSVNPEVAQKILNELVKEAKT